MFVCLKCCYKSKSPIWYLCNWSFGAKWVTFSVPLLGPILLGAQILWCSVLTLDVCSSCIRSYSYRIECPYWVLKKCWEKCGVIWGGSHLVNTHQNHKNVHIFCFLITLPGIYFSSKYQIKVYARKYYFITYNSEW